MRENIFQEIVYIHNYYNYLLLVHIRNPHSKIHRHIVILKKIKNNIRFPGLLVVDGFLKA